MYFRTGLGWKSPVCRFIFLHSRRLKWKLWELELLVCWPWLSSPMAFCMSESDHKYLSFSLTQSSNPIRRITPPGRKSWMDSTTPNTGTYIPTREKNTKSHGRSQWYKSFRCVLNFKLLSGPCLPLLNEIQFKSPKNKPPKTLVIKLFPGFKNGGCKKGSARSPTRLSKISKQT